MDVISHFHLSIHDHSKARHCVDLRYSATNVCDGEQRVVHMTQRYSMPCRVVCSFCCSLSSHIGYYWLAEAALLLVTGCFLPH